uniref:Uncharacterized protein n=1 Tax=Caenorhabditis japonica TaxID=281687 RepID=A0A8R1DU03_CAEJA
MDDGVFELISSSIVACNILTLVTTFVSVCCAVKKSQNMKSHRHCANQRRASTVEEKRKVRFFITGLPAI